MVHGDHTALRLLSMAVIVQKIVILETCFSAKRSIRSWHDMVSMNNPLNSWNPTTSFPMKFSKIHVDILVAQFEYFYMDHKQVGNKDID